MVKDERMKERRDCFKFSASLEVNKERDTLQKITKHRVKIVFLWLNAWYN